MIEEKRISEFLFIDNYDPIFDLGMLRNPKNLPVWEIKRIANKILRSGKVPLEIIQEMCDNIAINSK